MSTASAGDTPKAWVRVRVRVRVMVKGRVRIRVSGGHAKGLG